MSESKTESVDQVKIKTDEPDENESVNPKTIFKNAITDAKSVFKNTDWSSFFLKIMKSPKTYIMIIALIVGEVLFAVYDVSTQWNMLFVYSILSLIVTDYTNDSKIFFKGRSLSNRSIGFFTLTTSSTISWIFAKSITNSASLGYSYGFVGSVGYACYYGSFWVAAFVIYRLRCVYGYHNLAHALEERYGKLAAIVFGLTVAIRLFNEVWSNAAVVGSYFGAYGSLNWWGGCIYATIIPFVYIFMGGVKNSIVTDALQSLLTLALMIIILARVVPLGYDAGTHFVNEGDWSTINKGADFIVLALVQIWSYPFHDPVLTDHGFITRPKVFVTSFITAGVLAGTVIALFSFVGIYGAIIGVSGGPPVVARSLGTGYFDVIALLMMTSSVSVVDSTFSATARLIGLQLMGYIQKGRVLKAEETDWKNVMGGRIAMFILAIIGLLPLLGDPTVISATTISGTMVIGLAPPFLLIGLSKRNEKRYPLAFHLSFWCGLSLGIAQVAKAIPTSWNIGKGDYANLLGVNIYGSIMCFGLFFIGLLFPEDLLTRPFRTSAGTYQFSDEVEVDAKTSPQN